MIIPVITPRINAAPTLINPEAGVIVAKPAIAPVAAPTPLNLPPPVSYTHLRAHET